jgi:hypothetical protein
MGSSAQGSQKRLKSLVDTCLDTLIAREREQKNLWREQERRLPFQEKLAILEAWLNTSPAAKERRPRE